MMLLGFLERTIVIEMGMSWSLLVDRVSEPECNAEPRPAIDYNRCPVTEGVW